jgi:ligand-binding SRPBCC domain-containing protein
MKQEQKEYMILLILTDGVIHDKKEVKDLLVKCGRLPLSIIMIGIGNGDDWSAMHELDDDDMQMTDFQGNKTVRDLVQFVEFQKHNNNGVELASEVLYELPRQV